MLFKLVIFLSLKWRQGSFAYNLQQALETFCNISNLKQFAKNISHHYIAIKLYQLFLSQN